MAEDFLRRAHSRRASAVGRGGGNASTTVYISYEFVTNHVTRHIYFA